MKLLQIFFISLAISLKPLEDGGRVMLGFGHKPEPVAPAAFPAGAATSRAAPCTVCMTAC